MGRSANGLTEWRMKSGKTLQEYETGENNQLATINRRTLSGLQDPVIS